MLIRRLASGPDYRDQDPIVALDDFKKRVALYQSKYVPLGEYEEKNNMPYVQMIDVGRKVVSHQIRGYVVFLSRRRSGTSPCGPHFVGVRLF